MHTPDIAFIAADMPGGIDAAQNMLRTMPKPPKIILLSAEQVEAGPAAPVGRLAATALASTASKAISGYLTRRDDAAEMIALLAAVAVTCR